MIEVKEFYSELLNNDISFFTGVPDSLLKSFCAYIKDNVSRDKNIISANEGNAIGLAAGYHLGTRKIGLVYMQNSGIGNAVNPLASLADKLVYSIPMLLVIGWRGEPDTKDEPQHKKQGLITVETLDLLEIKYEVFDKATSNEEMRLKVKKAYKHMKKENEPYALVIKKDTFDKYKLKNNPNFDFEMTREEAIEVVIANMKKESVIVSTTGMASRELFELREKYKENHNRDFLTVGSMGHASQIAMGIAVSNNDKEVYCIDGDGALLMHLGGVAIIGNQQPKNFKHILINNGSHDSVGGQETVGLKIDTLAIAKACGYKKCYSCSSKQELIKLSKEISDIEGPILIEIKVKKGSRKDLGRPGATPIENKEIFMEFLDK